jgi:broad specificity phosphatase PhoE
MMPIRLFIVRHGQSEANVIREQDLDAKFAHVPDAEFRLTAKGVEQAKAAGAWLTAARETFEGKVIGFVSPFVRAKETAGNLGLNILWRPYPFLTERSWGEFSSLDPELQETRKKLKKRDPLYSRMPGGQSFSDLASTNYLFFSMLHREHSENTVVAVCHGERMLMIRYQLERITDEAFRALMNSQRTGDKVRNTQILEYTRRNPETGELATRIEWMRSFCPWDLREKDLKWKHLERKRLTDADLLAYAERHPHVLDAAGEPAPMSPTRQTKQNPSTPKPKAPDSD